MSDTVPAPRRSRESTRLLWVERLARFATAEQPVTAFCAAEGARPHYLRNHADGCVRPYCFCSAHAELLSSLSCRFSAPRSSFRR
jgi:hypothetical protein